MRVARCLLGLILLWFVLTAYVQPQGVGSSGTLSGTVRDPSGAVMPNATVVVEDPAHGVRRTTTTDSSGRYRFTDLSPATYTISADLPGFQKEIQQNIAVTVGGSPIIDFHLRMSSAKQEVIVTSEPPQIDTERGSQADTLTQRYIQDLPIDRRDYLTFTLLMPGVSNSN